MPTQHHTRPRLARGVKGYTLFELAAALSLGALAVGSVASGARALGEGLSLISERQVVASAFEHARREAYRGNQPTTARPGADQRSLVIEVQGANTRVFTLDRTRIVAGPRRGHVRFFGSGLAENATFTIANATGAQASIVVNQRGEIRWR